LLVLVPVPEWAVVCDGVNVVCPGVVEEGGNPDVDEEGRRAGVLVELVITEVVGLDVVDKEVGLLAWIVVVVCDPGFDVATIDD
jgi:hypothetical protein